MAGQTCKITAVDVAKLVNSDWSLRAELTLSAEIVLDKAIYTRKFTFVADDLFIHHIGRPLTQQDVEQALLNETAKLQSLHALAASLAPKIGSDLVAAATANTEAAAPALKG